MSYELKESLLKKLFIVMFLTIFLVGCSNTVVSPEETQTGNDVPTTPSSPSIPTTISPTTETGYAGVVLAGDKTPLLDFNKRDYDKAVVEGKIILLYFTAANCPICDTERKGLFDAFDEMSNSKIIGFRINYEDENTDESERQLAINLSIEGPHTKIILKDGKVLQKVTSTWIKRDYVNQLTRYLT